MTKKTDNKIMSVPEQIFEQFLTALGEQEVSEEVIARLRKTILENKQISADALKRALFFSDNTNV